MPVESHFDPYLSQLGLSPPVAHLRELYFRAMPEVCIERPRLITKYCKNKDLFGKERISILERTRARLQASEHLFGGTGPNQAIRIGGVKASGHEAPEDAVNELTYVMLRATELMMLRGRRQPELPLPVRLPGQGPPEPGHRQAAQLSPVAQDRVEY